MNYSSKAKAWEENYSNLLTDVSLIFPIWMKAKSQLFILLPDVGWVPFRGNIDEIFEGIPISDDEMWQMVASGDLDLLKNITLEARARHPSIRNVFRGIIS